MIITSSRFAMPQKAPQHQNQNSSLFVHLQPFRDASSCSTKTLLAFSSNGLVTSSRFAMPQKAPVQHQNFAFSSKENKKKRLASRFAMPQIFKRLRCSTKTFVQGK